MTAPIHQALADKGLLPAAHLADAGYVDADLLISSHRDHEIDRRMPIAFASRRVREAAARRPGSRLGSSGKGKYFPRISGATVELHSGFTHGERIYWDI